MKQQSSKTIRKVKAASGGAAAGGGAAWALMILVVWLMTANGVVVPEEVKTALEILFALIFPAAGAWLAGYKVSPGPFDGIE